MKKNPMTFNSQNLRRWLFLYVPHASTLAQPLKVLGALEKYFGFYIERDHEDYYHIKNMIIEICDNWQAIYATSGTKWQMEEKWRKFINEKYNIKLLYGLITNAISGGWPKINYYDTVDRIRVRAVKNPMTRTWDNLRKWIYLNLGKYEIPNNSYKVIEISDASKAAEVYFDLSRDPIEELIYKNKNHSLILRNRLLNESLRNRHGLRIGQQIPYQEKSDVWNRNKQYITKYSEKYNKTVVKNPIFRYAVGYFALKWEIIYNSKKSKFEKDREWRKVALEDDITYRQIEKAQLL